ncbi:MAG TPA: alpha-E domain-containing protein [Acidimicrobiia bacterium]|nr:alpha-E domain-containing protein [Acidimicrobiia bacterium]
MLARHAEDLFWMGRYLERSENTARLLDVTYHAVLEAIMPDPERQWRDLLEVLALDDAPGAEEAVNASSITRFLLAGAENPGSIRNCVARCRENARAVRDALSAEMWEAINTFHLELARSPVAQSSTYELFRVVKARCHLVAGAATATMPRGEGYRFFVLGGVMERAILTSRWLAHAYSRFSEASGSGSFHEWVVILKSMSAYEAYLRLHRASMEPGRVLEFLLQSRDYPRSVLWCLNVADSQVQRLATNRIGRQAARMSGRLRAEVEFADASNHEPKALAGLLSGVSHDLESLASAIEADYFRPGADESLHSYEAI